nr:hypothetical protein [Tanacetum cinerariifolium]
MDFVRYVIQEIHAFVILIQILLISSDSYHSPHPTYETYSVNSCGNDSHFGTDCPPRFLPNYEPEPGYIQNYNFYPHDSPSFPQQYLCCDNCGGVHETFQCQSMNHDFYNSNSLSFDLSQTSQFPVIHPPPQETSIKILHDQENEINYVETFLKKFNLSPDFPLIDTLIMENEHLDTIPEMESDEFIKSSVENLVPIPSEFEDFSIWKVNDFYNSNSSSFDQSQTPQFPVIHPPPQETSIEILYDQENKINSVATFLRKFNRYSFFETPKVLLRSWDRVFKIKDALGNKQYKTEDTQELFRELFNDVQNIHEELAEYINTPGWNRPAFCNNGDDDDEDCTIAVSPDFPLIDALIMENEHLDTIPEMESDEFIKSCVENLVPIPSEFEDFPIWKVNIDSLLAEFAGELIFLESIPPGVDEANCDPEEDIHLVERLLYDNSSPRPPEEFVSENSNAETESFSPSPIPDEDSDSRMEEMDLTFTPDDPMPLSIEDDDNDSERDILILEEFPSNYSLSLPVNESFYFDIPSFSRPPAKPPDGNT